MQLMEQEQTIGIELEFYGSKDLARDICRGHGLDVVGDASLGGDGVEVRFDTGVPIKDSMPRIDLMHKIVTGGTSLTPEFVTTYDNILLPKNDKTNHINVEECDEYYEFGNVGRREGTTGLHIHFGMPSEYSFLDLIALSDFLNKNDKLVRELSWRDSPVWARDTYQHISSVQHRSTEIVRDWDLNVNWQSMDMAHDLPRLTLEHDKYMGMNIRNVGSGIHTLEFRYADSLLLADKVAFEKYLKFLAKACQDHLVNRKELTIEGSGQYETMTMKEVLRKPHTNGLASVTLYDVYGKDDNYLYRGHSIR